MINQIIIFGEIEQLSKEPQKNSVNKNFKNFNITVKNHYSENEKPYLLKCQIWDKHYAICKKHIYKGNNLLIKGKLISYDYQQFIDVEEIIIP